MSHQARTKPKTAITRALEIVEGLAQGTTAPPYEIGVAYCRTDHEFLMIGMSRGEASFRIEPCREDWSREELSELIRFAFAEAFNHG